MNQIVVIGSSNLDYIVTVDRFPQGGETLEGSSFSQAMGGKGANQAVATRRSGGNVSFITSVGDDQNGENALAQYKKEGMDVSRSLVKENVTTGAASIWVDSHGENSIVVIPGANQHLTSDYIIPHSDFLSKADIILMQMEIPYETVKTVCKIASENTKVILNVAPARSVDDEVLQSLYMLVVNETEAETISECKIDEIGEEGVVKALLEKGVKNVILTLGSKGSMYSNGTDWLKVPAFKVQAVDTTAAGDTFCGALVVGIGKYGEMKKALTYATAASALCVTALGAQPSIPYEKDILAFLEKNNIHL
ncbi:MAG: ribokinase [Petrimonas sp.]|jgi:ribokinase